MKDQSVKARGVALAGLTLALLVVAGLNILAAWRVGPYYQDYLGFVAAGRVLDAGGDPYRIPTDEKVPPLPGITDRGIAVPWPQASPPTILPFCQELARFDPAQGGRLWLVSTLVAFGALLLLLRRIAGMLAALFVAVLLASFPFHSTLDEGQIYVILAVEAAGAWLALKSGRPRLAGVLIGLLVAIKPNVAVWPLALILAGSVTPGLVAIGMAGVIGLVPVLLYGPTIYLHWLSSSVTFTTPVMYNGSVFAVADRLGLPGLTRPLGIVLAAVLCAILLLWAFRARRDALLTSAASLVVALLAAPIAFTGYLIIAFPILVERRWWPATLTVLPLLVLPQSALEPLLVLGVGVALCIVNPKIPLSEAVP